MKAPIRTTMPPGAGGSFNKPEAMKSAIEQDRSRRRTSEEEHEFRQSNPAPSNKPDSIQDEGWSVPTPTPDIQLPKEDVPDSFEEVLKPEGVLKELKRLGVEITEEDIEYYLFKGSLEKTIPIFKISNKKTFTAKIRTLTGDQYMVVEEIVGDSLRITDMTREGVSHLRTIAVLSMAVVDLMGRPTIKTWGSDISEKIKAMENMTVIKALAPGVINKINHLHSAMTVAFNTMLDEGNSPFLTSF